MTKRRRCPFCKRLYWPNPHVAQRQWSCTAEACQTQRRAETQRRFRAKHPAEATGRRYRLAVARAKDGDLPSLPRAPPAAMARFPWSELKDECGAQGLITVALLVRLLVGCAKDVSRVQLSTTTEEFAGLLRTRAKDVSRAQPTVAKEESAELLRPPVRDVSAAPCAPM